MDNIVVQAICCCVRRKEEEHRVRARARVEEILSRCVEMGGILEGFAIMGVHKGFGEEPGFRMVARTEANSKAKPRRDYVDTTHLVRSVQRTEGNFDCFGTAGGHCDQLDCAWRAFCLDKS
ncbi:hypothetical protein ACFL0Q_06030 [Thermodesulfobacteriota bacterium]